VLFCFIIEIHINKTANSTSSTMASITSHSSNKDQKTGFPIQAVVDAIVNIDREVFKEFARNMDRETFKLLSACLVELGQDMEDALTKFVDIPSIVIASNVFPYLKERDDWNHFSLVNKDINDAVTKHKQLEPPWPFVKLMAAGSTSRFAYTHGRTLSSDALSADEKFIAHLNRSGRVYLWNRTKGLVANWQGHSTPNDEDDEDDDDDDEAEVYIMTFSPDDKLLLTAGYDSIKS
jgi:hypothetical protein